MLAKAQDSIVLPPNYIPYFNWEALNDSLTLEYQALYPRAWKKDSAYLAQKNKVFFDSVFQFESIAKKLLNPVVEDSALAKPSLTQTPPSNKNNVYVPPLPNWFYWVILLVLVGIIFLKYANIKLFGYMFLSLLFPKYCDEALKEYDSPINLYNLVATLICALTFSLFFWVLMQQQLTQELNMSGSVVFVLSFVIFSIFYLVRYLAIMIAAVVLDAEYVYNVLVQVTLSGNLWAAIIVFPLLALLSSTILPVPDAAYLSYAWWILLIYLVIKQVRVFVQTVNAFPHSIVYLILYLCALEIAPYLAIYKILINKLG